jgi:hypothetical protein
VAMEEGSRSMQSREEGGLVAGAGVGGDHGSCRGGAVRGRGSDMGKRDGANRVHPEEWGRWQREGIN